MAGKTEAEKRLHRCCFTGHRPEKLRDPQQAVIEALRMAIDQAVDDGLTVFLSGMARGVDLWAAELVLNKRETNPSVKLICAAPYPECCVQWAAPWKEQYIDVWKRADVKRTICPHYEKSCFQRRNQWMVDHSARVIAVWNGSGGGTKNTIEYALAHGVAVQRLKVG